MEKVRPWCGQPSDRGRLRNRTEQTGQVSLPCNMLFLTQLLYNLPLIIRDTSLLVSRGTNCLNLLHCCTAAGTSCTTNPQPTSAVNVTLLAFAALRHAAAPLLLSAGRAAIDRYLLPAGRTESSPQSRRAASK